MEQEIDPSEEYIRHFNLGYDINRQSPEIAELLEGLKPDSERWKAFKAGMDERSKELQPSRTLSWLEKNRDEPQKDADFNKDKSDFEPDR